ncbi:hypothetical protein CsatB_014494 [Cannabis sativa]|uniref:uncharacterized mitochondrial protein AtMg00810-like n=1 Tax=Cannabis sativa TaxID=3483 RepID=UPI0029CA4FED|nr:uncharacterized mitochondrial protein AtMg00810-like [Cannabis sativa]
MQGAKTSSTSMTNSLKLSQFGSDPILDPSLYRGHLKRILGYLVGSLDHGIHLTKCSSFAVQAFCEADWASDPDDRRSTSGYCVLLDSNLVAWKSKKQQTISRSSTEVEFHNLAALVTDITWL